MYIFVCNYRCSWAQVQILVDMNLSLLDVILMDPTRDIIYPLFDMNKN